MLIDTNTLKITSLPYSHHPTPYTHEQALSLTLQTYYDSYEIALFTNSTRVTFKIDTDGTRTGKYYIILDEV